MSNSINPDSKPAAEAIAEPMEEYSGEVSLVVPKTLHKKLTEAAKAEGVELNQYLVALLSERNAVNAIGNVQAELDAANQRLREREAVMRQMERRAREQRLSYDNRYIEDIESGLND
ncbi:MAG: toxin-antitoxin system HicB family antitoxin [Cyanobacteria bacterium P01_D01_bin.105]